MNKAFVREPEDNGSRNCPRCGSLGISVPRETVAGLVRPAVLDQISSTAFFCPFPQCEVAYFDLLERVVAVDELVRPIWPKDREAPICSCFGLTREDVEADVAEGVVSRTREVVLKAKSGEADCVHKAPTGQPCVAEVQRYYMKLRGGELS